MKSAVIEDKKIIEKIKDEYRRRGWIRDLILFVLSINTGVKLVNLLDLKVSDIKNKEFLKFKDVTNITRVFPLNFDVRKENKKVIRFHKMMGAKIVGENDIDYFFECSKADYLKNVNQFINNDNQTISV